MTTNIPELGPDRLLDVRDVPCSSKHGWIVQTFVNLQPGEYFILRNGHEPVPLRYQFEAEYPETFTWETVHKLPDDVAVKITKTRELKPSARALPGACGGH